MERKEVAEDGRTIEIRITKIFGNKSRVGEFSSIDYQKGYLRGVEEERAAAMNAGEG